MELPVGLRHVLSETRLHTDDREYVIVSLPLDQLHEGMAALAQRAEPFSAAVVDKDELTLVMPGDVWRAARDELDWEEEAAGYRLITFDVSLGLGLVGYVATLSHVVAAAGVSQLVFSAYQRDHLLVPSEDFERAWAALSDFIDACRKQG
ncbi:MAG: ACT domain-containing protein [Anaerolineae bacterium]|nr:ACT domain-containing protein [Anaerolineae bacterium]